MKKERKPIIQKIEFDEKTKEPIKIQLQGDEIAEQIAEEMLVTAPEPVTLAADEERSYKISLYKQDIDLILQSLRAANVPQDDYDRIYEIIGKAEM